MPFTFQPGQIKGVFVSYFARGIGRWDAQVEVEPSVSCFIALNGMPPKSISIFEGLELKTAFVALIAGHCYHIPYPGETITLAFRPFTLSSLSFRPVVMYR